jgi:hypothetical protein
MERDGLVRWPVWVTGSGEWTGGSDKSAGASRYSLEAVAAVLEKNVSSATTRARAKLNNVNTNSVYSLQGFLEYRLPLHGIKGRQRRYMALLAHS